MIRILFQNVVLLSFLVSIFFIILYPFLSKIEKTYKTKWRYYLWLLISIRLIIPLPILYYNTPITIPYHYDDLTIGILEDRVYQKVTSLNREAKTNISKESFSLDYNKESYEISNNSNNSNSSNSNQSNNNNQNNVTQYQQLQNKKDAENNQVTIKNLILSNGLLETIKDIRLMPLLSFLWLIGVISYLSYYFINYLIYINRMKKNSYDIVEDKILDILNKEKKILDIKGKILLKSSDSINSPMMLGYLRPIIVLDEESLNDESLHLIVRHELVHFKRHDIWYKFILLCATGVHFFNPLIHQLIKLAERDIELSCDEDVLHYSNIDCREEYCDTILRAIGHKKSGKNLLTTSFYSNKKTLKLRFSNILEQTNRKSGKFSFAFIMIVLLLSSSFVSCSTGRTVKEESKTVIEQIYDTKMLYVGNHINVRKVIGTLEWPEGIQWNGMELQTKEEPYGIIMNYKIVDKEDISFYDEDIKERVIDGTFFYKNAILMFSLIDNVDNISINLEDTVEYSDTTMGFTITRGEVESWIGLDVRDYTQSIEGFTTFYNKIYAFNSEDIKEYHEKYNNDTKEETTDKKTIDKGIANEEIANKETTTDEKRKQINIQGLVSEEVGGKIEEYLKIIESSPTISSNPYDYIEAHIEEYENILKFGDEGLVYLLEQFKSGESLGLRGTLMKILCVELLDERNNVVNWEELTSKEWYDQLDIIEAIDLPDFDIGSLFGITFEQKQVVDKDSLVIYIDDIKELLKEDRILFLAYAGALNKYNNNDPTIATIVAPIIYGSTNIDGKIEIFTTVFIKDISVYGTTLKEVSGSIIPTKIVYEWEEESEDYVLTDYIEAMDGSYWASSIREFCGKNTRIAEEMIQDYSTEEIKELMDENISFFMKYIDFVGEDSDL